MKFLYHPDTVLTASDLETLALDLLTEIPIPGVEGCGFDSGIIRQTLLQAAVDQKSIKAVTDSTHETYSDDYTLAQLHTVPADELDLSYRTVRQEGDKPPVFTLVDRGNDQRYVVPAKFIDESTVRLLLADHEEEPLTAYTGGFRAYDPLEKDDAFAREYVVHGDGEYADGDVHVNTCESHGSLVRPWLSPHRGASKDKLTPSPRAFQLRRELYRKPGDKALKHAIDAAL